MFYRGTNPQLLLGVQPCRPQQYGVFHAESETPSRTSCAWCTQRVRTSAFLSFAPSPFRATITHGTAPPSLRASPSLTCVGVPNVVPCRHMKKNHYSVTATRQHRVISIFKKINCSRRSTSTANYSTVLVTLLYPLFLLNILCSPHPIGRRTEKNPNVRKLLFLVEMCPTIHGVIAIWLEHDFRAINLSFYYVISL